jgi:hypothetical protein
MRVNVGLRETATCFALRLAKSSFTLETPVHQGEWEMELEKPALAACVADLTPRKEDRFLC